MCFYNNYYIFVCVSLVVTYFYELFSYMNKHNI